MFPCKIMVSQLSGSGDEALFMGVVKRVEPDPKVIRVWLMPGGTILCLDQRFVEWCAAVAEAPATTLAFCRSCDPLLL